MPSRRSHSYPPGSSMNNKNYRSLLIIASTFVATIIVFRYSPGIAPRAERILTEASQSRVASIDFQGFEARLSELEQSLDRTAEIQNQMLQLFAEVHGNDKPSNYARSELNVRRKPPIRVLAPNARGPEPIPGRDWPNTQLQRLIAEGLSPERAVYILELEQRFWREQTWRTLELGRRGDEATQETSNQAEKPEASKNATLRLRELLNEELSPSELASYLVATKGEIEFLITAIRQGSVAESAGLQAGDRIRSYNGEPVLDALNMRTLMAKVPPGELVEIEIQRSDSGDYDRVYIPSGPLGIEVIPLSPGTDSEEKRE